MDSDIDNDTTPENTDDEKSNEKDSDDDLNAKKLAKITEYNFDKSTNDENENRRLLRFLELVDENFCSYALRPMYQDVTPSFADEVPFLVDGDSLLITIMMDKNWSNQFGGSSLHLVYLFERYLNIFIHRGGTFHLVFFENWRNIWHTNWNILLHRSILINHFSKNVQKYPVHIFEHCFDEDFTNLISILRPGFILTNMDAYEDCADFFNIEKNLLKHINNINLINWLTMDLPCIDTNHIEVDVSIVRGYYLECNYEVKRIVHNHENKFIKFITSLPKIEDCLDLPDGMKLDKKYDIRKATFLTAAYLYYKRNKNKNMVNIFILTCAIMEFLKLKNRCCPKFTTPPEKLDKLVEEWHKCMFFALSELENENYDHTVVADMWQGILFGHVCRFLLSTITKSEELGSEISSIYENMVQDFNTFGSLEKVSISAYPIEMNSDIKFETINFIKSERRDHKPLIPIKNQLNLSFCGDILDNIKWCDPTNILIEKQYTEEHHYHTMKVITDEHDHIRDNIQRKPANEWEQRRYLHSRNMHAKYMTLYGSSIEGRPLKTSAVIRNSKHSSNKKEKGKESKKKKELLEAKFKTDSLEQEKKDREKFEKLDKQYKNYNGDLDIFLDQINLVLDTKSFSEGSYKMDTLFLKLKVLRTILKDKARIIDKDKKYEKTIFLTAREILNSGCNLSSKNKVLLSKCLSEINCTEIAKRNKLPVQNEPSPEDDAWIRFQLEHLGPDLIRETGGKPDSRVRDFIPDPWQSDLFDIVDKRQSALIVAPTSSGKTYASYYCMESVLREGTEGVVVYVAPTKALVNQVAATVYARFKDTHMPDGMSVYGIFTRDYKMYALTSQVLVTVPQCLEILLLSPRRHTWVKRIRYVIFDEIHCIDGIGGAAFERCLLLIRCPFLALSATIRNPKGFHEWMQRAEKYKHDRDIDDGYLREKDSYKVHLVEHSERHSDLTKFTYGNGRLHHLHPYAELEAGVIDKHKGIPSHMTLSPAETIQLYNTMRATFPNCESLIQLSPVIFFSSFPENGFISRNLVRQYESKLSAVLTNWFYDYEQYFKNTINNLKPTEVDEIGGTGRLYIKENIVDFVLHLKEQNMLPAIIFAYSRIMIKDMTTETTKYFEENKKKDDSTTLSKRKENICVVKPVEDRLETKKYKAKALQSFTGKAETSLESISSNMAYIDRRNLRRSMKYDEPLNLICEYASQSVQGIGVMDSDDMKFVEQRLRRAGITSNHLISMSMRNGLCMHHSGLGNKVRGAVEMLFRKKFLNVVFATGTLALGIHMPCKTTVIAGNSAWLNSLEYHQMSGRAGRRGYDTAGNVVFLGMNPRKQHSLLTAKLPSLKGNFPVTVSLILRALLLVSDVTDKGKQSEEATKISISRVLTMLENSLCYMENPELKINIKHFFSFALQLLKIQEFINENGEPLKWCGLGTRLHYHEPGNLAFVYLLRTGVFRQICSKTKNVEEIPFKLLTILSYLFTRIPLDAASKKEVYCNSKVILDPLPEIASKALNQYNKEVRFVFEQYFANVATYIGEEDNIIPVSSVKIIGNSYTEDEQSLNIENLQNNFLNMCTPQYVCSSFATLSGNNDSNAYTEDTLISNLKHKMATDVKVIPLVNLKAELNGYAVDFYRHGSVKSIISDNGIREGNEFTLLTDFLLVLKTICVILEEMKVETETDIVYRHFKQLETKYFEIHSKAFGKDHM